MSETKKPSPWIWLSLGLIIGLFVAFILFLDQNIVNSARQQAPAGNSQSNQVKPIFDFYKVLPERTMDIPDAGESQPNIPNTPDKKNSVAGGGSFIMQAGSFQKMQDAERQRIELTLKGFEPKIATASVKGINYYRVELGPFNEHEYSSIQKSLIEHDIRYLRKNVKP